MGVGRLALRSMATTSTSKTMDISGVYPPITTPFNPDESIAWDELKNNLTKWNKVDTLRGYLVQGSNGEYCYLTNEERVEMIKRVKEYAGPNKLVLAGSGMESTKATVKMTNDMADAGADAAVVITPNYFKSRMTPAALLDHFTSVHFHIFVSHLDNYINMILQVANDSKIPVILYSVPANTTIDLPIDVIANLAPHPNIIGMKESGGDVAKIGQIVHTTEGTNFAVLAGSASFLLPSMAVGAVGAISALANALPEAIGDLEKLYRDGKMFEARKLQHRLIAPNAIVTAGLGVPALKKAMEWMGYYGGPVRKPLQPLTETEEAMVRKAFSKTGFLN